MLAVNTPASSDEVTTRVSFSLFGLGMRVLNMCPSTQYSAIMTDVTNMYVKLIGMPATIIIASARSLIMAKSNTVPPVLSKITINSISMQKLSASAVTNSA